MPQEDKNLCRNVLFAQILVEICTAVCERESQKSGCSGGDNVAESPEKIESRRRPLV